MPPRLPSSSTKVTRKPDTKGARAAILSSIFLPVPLVQPSTTTSPPFSSSAAMRRSRGSSARNSGVAMVPSMTDRAPASR
jgi:hypothetical protein